MIRKFHLNRIETFISSSTGMYGRSWWRLLPSEILFCYLSLLGRHRWLHHRHREFFSLGKYEMYRSLEGRLGRIISCSSLTIFSHRKFEFDSEFRHFSTSSKSLKSNKESKKQKKKKKTLSIMKLRGIHTSFFLNIYKRVTTCKKMVKFIHDKEWEVNLHCDIVVTYPAKIKISGNILVEN